MIDPEETIDAISNIHIPYPRLQKTYNKIRTCHQSFKRNRRPVNLVITGMTGVGKSEICTQYANNYPKIKTGEDNRIPVLKVSTPGDPTIKQLASKILYYIGDPGARKGSAESMTLRIYEFIEACKIELLILDEFQHFLDSGLKALEKATRWLKTLIEDVGISIVLVGMPEAEYVIRMSRQLNRRFSHREKLKPFGWSSTDDVSEFKRLLNNFEKKMPITVEPGLSDEDMPSRLYYASNGIIDAIKTLLINGADFAFDKKLASIDKNCLGHAFDEHLRSQFPEKSNPFYCKDFHIDKKRIAEIRAFYMKQIQRYRESTAKIKKKNIPRIKLKDYFSIR